MALMVVLMLAILAIAATIVIRLGFPSGSGPVSAEALDIPAGEVLGLGQGEGTVLVVVRGDDGTERLFVFDAHEGGGPISETVVRRPDRVD